MADDDNKNKKEKDISRFIARANEDISRLIARFAECITHRFRCFIRGAGSDSNPVMDHSIRSSIHVNRAFAVLIAQSIIYCCFIIPGIKKSWEETLYNIVVERNQPKPIERFLGFYKYSRNQYLKGLKEISDTDTGFPQVVEHHQEDTSRVVVPSSRSTVDDQSQESVVNGESFSFSMLANSMYMQR